MKTTLSSPRNYRGKIPKNCQETGHYAILNWYMGKALAFTGGMVAYTGTVQSNRNSRCSALAIFCDCLGQTISALIFVALSSGPGVLSTTNKATHEICTCEMLRKASGD